MKSIPSSPTTPTPAPRLETRYRYHCAQQKKLTKAPGSQTSGNGCLALLKTGMKGYRDTRFATQGYGLVRGM